MTSTRKWCATTGRNKVMLAMRRNGKKYKEIGETFGITPERVRQIILKQNRLGIKRKVSLAHKSRIEKLRMGDLNLWHETWTPERQWREERSVEEYASSIQRKTQGALTWLT